MCIPMCRWDCAVSFASWLSRVFNRYSAMWCSLWLLLGRSPYGMSIVHDRRAPGAARVALRSGGFGVGGGPGREATARRLRGFAVVRGFDADVPPAASRTRNAANSVSITRDVTADPLVRFRSLVRGTARCTAV